MQGDFILSSAIGQPSIIVGVIFSSLWTEPLLRSGMVLGHFPTNLSGLITVPEW